MAKKISLFDFQAEDVEQLKTRKSRLCGNDPGTGKTYVGLALDQENRAGRGHPKVPVPRNAKTLIIAPKSVLSTWDEHCMELTDEYVYMIDTNKQPAKGREEFLKDLLDPRKGGYFICHWDSLRLLEPAITKKRLVFFHIIADEVHRAKNKKSQQTRALKKLQTWYKTGLSGTPADNKPQDLWSILNWLWPSYYTSFWQFVKAYLKTETDEKTGYKKFVGVNEETVPILRKEMKNWYVRRRKEDVLKDLPPKYYSRVMVELHPQQKRAYNEMRKTMIAWCDEHREDLELESPLIASAVVAQLQRLQQFADGYMRPLRDEQGNHVYKWRWPKGVTREERKQYQQEWAQTHPGEPFDPEFFGAVKVYQYEMIEPSAKIDALMDILDDRLGFDEGEWHGEQIVVFAQSKQAIRLLEQRLIRAGIPHGIYTGDTSEADRTKIRHEFQNGTRRVFAGTIKAGGVGLTLTAASTVVFIDREWSPSANGQAEDRLHRIGQKDAVEVIDLMAKNTVDLGKKQQLTLKAHHLSLLLGDKINPDEVADELSKSKGSPILKSLLDYNIEDEQEEEEDGAA